MWSRVRVSAALSTTEPVVPLRVRGSAIRMGAYIFDTLKAAYGILFYASGDIISPNEFVVVDPRENVMSRSPSNRKRFWLTGKNARVHVVAQLHLRATRVAYTQSNKLYGCCGHGEVDHVNGPYSRNHLAIYWI